MAALAGVGQVVVLIVTARFVWRYLDETQKMRKAAENQVGKSQELVKAAQQQLAASLMQTESQIRPAVSVRLQGGIQLQNVGNGTAVDVAFSLVDLDDGEINWELSPNRLSEIVASYLEPGEDPNRRVAIADRRFGPDIGLQLRYQSLSGRKYASLITFGMDGRVIRTRFVEEAD
jgi:hypothetical protein